MDERMRRSVALERAHGAGDLVAARAAVEDRDAFPETTDAYAGSTVANLALFHAPVAAVVELLDAGADPNFVALDGFPAVLLVVLHREDPAERDAVVDALLAAGAHVDARGINDWTALHVAAALGEEALVDRLLAAGADAGLRTRIDDLTKPADEAAAAGHHDVAARLHAAGAG